MLPWGVGGVRNTHKSALNSQKQSIFILDVFGHMPDVFGHMPDVFGPMYLVLCIWSYIILNSIYVFNYISLIVRQYLLLYYMYLVLCIKSYI